MAINPEDITTARVGELTPENPLLTSIIPHEIDEQLYSCTIQELVQLLNLNVGTLQYEVKTLYVDQEYIDTNFDSTGLGRLLCAGFAIINGNNGTPPSDGMFEIAQNEDYPIGSYGGYKDTVIVEHSHKMVVSGSETDGNANSLYNGTNTGRFSQGLTSRAFDQSSDPFDYELTSSNGTIDSGQTSIEGVSGEDRNMPPYFSVLKIMKL